MFHVFIRSSNSDVYIICSRGFVPTATPTPAFAFLLYMYYDIHSSTFQELDGSLSNVFDICGLGSNDVNDTKNFLFTCDMTVAMVVVVVVVVMVM